MNNFKQDFETRKLHPSCQRILSLNGGFKDYDVVYDDISQIAYLTRRANALDVALNDGLGLKLNNAIESCSGNIRNCITYLRNYLEADGGWQGAMTLYFDDISKVDPKEFTIFCNWMNEWLSDWNEGIKDNPQLKKLLQK